MKTHQWDCAIDPLISPFFLYLQWTQSKSINLMRAVLTQYKLSLAEFDVLATLRNAALPYQMTPSQIQEEVVITSGGLTKVMLNLEARGLVQRLQERSDLRIKPINLTSDGKILIESAMADAIGVTGKWIRGALDNEKIEQFTRLMKVLVDHRS